jgi:mannose/fructose/N-acetylgalactosamine-specific phosphotransferase system component IID
MTDSTPITKIKFLIPKGMKIEEIIQNLQISFEEKEETGEEFNQNVCCVDVALVSPVSTINNH